MTEDSGTRSLDRSACKSCGATILWAFTRNGKRMPLDADPIRRVVLQNGQTAVVRNTYVTHFETCPKADKHRTKAGT